MSTAILIVDDDPVQRRLLETAVTGFGYSATGMGCEEAGRLLGSAARRFALAIVDLTRPDCAFLERLRQSARDLPVIAQTSDASGETVIGAMRAGAIDFVVKPPAPERLQVSIANVLRLDALEDEVERMRRSATGTLALADIATRSPKLRQALRLAEKAARSTIPVLLEGEAGVGKKLFARAIHGSSVRRSRPFVAVACTLPDREVEALLFGEQGRPGRLAEAEGGTLFLDSVDALSPQVQARLLEMPRDGMVAPPGGRLVRADVRIIAGTGRGPPAFSESGALRGDLLHRLGVFPIAVPPLRERREDIPDLVRLFIARFAAEERKPQILGIAPAALDLLAAYRWPGNVRELENAVFRAVVLGEGPNLTVQEFPQISAKVEGLAALRQRMPAAGPDRKARRAVEAFADGEVRTLEDVEAEMIRLALDHYGGRMSLIARRLGIGRSTLYRKLREAGLHPADEVTAAQ